jgi:outer membrane lipoprotein-sorting protein
MRRGFRCKRESKVKGRRSKVQMDVVRNMVLWSRSRGRAAAVALAVVVLPALCAIAGEPTAEQVLLEIDRNMSSSNRVFTSRMIIHGRRGVRAVQSKSWGEGDAKAFTEYLAPAREKGTKMLKLEDRLWLYSPATDRTIQISGHMLRQSVMGSDLSYEDMMEDKRLASAYTAEITGEEEVDDRPCWVIELTAREKNIAYHRRRVWVDRERMIPLRQELYAKSGKLLKRTELTDVKQLEGRWFPTRILFKDMLKNGEGTEFIIEAISFDQPIPDHIFTKAALRK